jgi:hypothetical protein
VSLRKTRIGPKYQKYPADLPVNRESLFKKKVRLPENGRFPLIEYGTLAKLKNQNNGNTN